MLLDAATDPAFQEQLRTRTSDAHARASPAAALATAAQAALSSSYLQKLRQVAEDESQLGTAAVDGVLVLLTLNPRALGTADCAGAALLPPEVWAKAQQCRMQACWLAGGNASADELAALAMAVRSAGVSTAAAESLAAIAAPGLGRATFSELLPLPALAPVRGQEATSAVPAEDEALAWLADLDEDVPMPNLLHALVSSVEGCSEREREAIRREIQKRMRQQQRAAVGGVPPGAGPARGGGGGTAAARKGQRALQQAQLLQARGKENRPRSRPASVVPPTNAAAAPDEWWAGDEAGEEEDEEVSSVMPLDPPTAAAELRRQLAALEEELATAAGAAEEECGVGGAAAMLDGREISRRVQAAVEAAFRAMAKHHRQGAGAGAPPPVEQHRALLLSRAGMSVAELHRRHRATKPLLPGRPTRAQRDTAHAVMRRALPGVAATCMLQALLRLHVAAYGE